MKSHWNKLLAIIPLLWTCCADSAEKPAASSPANAGSAESAWQDVQNALRPPPPPAEWRTNPPSEQVIAEYERKNGVLAGQAADKARAFHEKFPNDTRVDEARKMEVQLLGVAVKLGATNRTADFRAARDKRLSDPKVTPDEKFDLKSEEVIEALEDVSSARPARLASAEKAAQALRDEFPTREDASRLLLTVAEAHINDGSFDRARSLAINVEAKAPAATRDEAKALLRKIDRVGKPLPLKFTDVGGKAIDIKDYAGKVILLDFWATWCGPCVAALPEVKDTYAKYRPKGFEIIGISLDRDKEALTQFTATEKMTWPQYFDGLMWENKLAGEFEITGIPALWLVDKKGRLRDLNGRHQLEAKIEKLLAEQ